MKNNILDSANKIINVITEEMEKFKEGDQIILYNIIRVGCQEEIKILREVE